MIRNTLIICFILITYGCGQVKTGDTDRKIDCVDGCSPAASPSPSPGCKLEPIEGGSVLTCGNQSVLILDPGSGTDAEEVGEEELEPSPSPGSQVIIYQCKKHSKKDK
jgi:hypothetical protein